MQLEDKKSQKLMMDGQQNLKKEMSMDIEMLKRGQGI